MIANELKYNNIDRVMIVKERRNDTAAEEVERKNEKPTFLDDARVFIVLCFAASGIGALFTTSSVSDWYPTLIKPSWISPSWLFGPV